MGSHWICGRWTDPSWRTDRVCSGLMMIVCVEVSIDKIYPKLLSGHIAILYRFCWGSAEFFRVISVEVEEELQVRKSKLFCIILMTMSAIGFEVTHSAEAKYHSHQLSKNYLYCKREALKLIISASRLKRPRRKQLRHAISSKTIAATLHNVPFDGKCQFCTS